MPSPSPQYDVFLSHNSRDKDAVRAIAVALRAKGVKCWFDEWNLVAGQQWQKGLTDGLEDSRACAVFFGESGLGPWHDLEQQLANIFGAAGRGYGIIPVRLHYAPEWAKLDVPPFLRLYHGVNFRSLDDALALDRLVAGIKGETPAPPAAAQEGTPPYVGMRALGRDEQGQFFGRDRYVLDLLERMRATVAPRLTFVLGASGSGKSSLLAAGLLPRLEAGDIESSERWLCTMIKPGQDPWVSLRTGLRKVPEFAKHADTLVPTRPETWLHEAAALAAGDDAGTAHPRRVILVVDQFEEVFTSRPPGDAEAAKYEEQSLRPFLTNLYYAAAAQDGPVTVILSLRRDFFAAVEDDAVLGPAAKERPRRLMVEGMTEPELRCAIERPALTRGVTFEAGLVSAICEDFRLQPAGSLPFLQAALLRMWMGREDDGPMRNRTYEEMGRLRGAVNDHAQKVYQTLSPAEQKLARPVFLHLTRLSDEDGQDTKRRMPLADLPGGAPAVNTARKLAGGEMRLLTIDTEEDSSTADGGPAQGGSRTATVEIAHEALLSGWEDLRRWIGEKRNERLQLRHLEALLRGGEGGDEARAEAPALLTGKQLKHAGRVTTLLADETPPGVLRLIASSRRTQRIRRMAVAVILVAGFFGILAISYYQVVVPRRAQQKRDLAQKNRELVHTLLGYSSNTTESPRLRYLLAQEALARADKDQKDRARRLVREASFALGPVPLRTGFYFGDQYPPDFNDRSEFPAEVTKTLGGLVVAGKNVREHYSVQPLSPGMREFTVDGRWATELPSYESPFRFQFDLFNAEPCQTLAALTLPEDSRPHRNDKGVLLGWEAKKGLYVLTPGGGDKPVSLPIAGKEAKEEEPKEEEDNRQETGHPAGNNEKERNDLKTLASFSPDGRWVLVHRNVYQVAGLTPAAQPFPVPGEGAPAFLMEEGVLKLVWVDHVYSQQQLKRALWSDDYYRAVERYVWHSVIPGDWTKISEETFTTAEALLRKHWHVLPEVERAILEAEGAGSVRGRWLVRPEVDGHRNPLALRAADDAAADDAAAAIAAIAAIAAAAAAAAAAAGDTGHAAAADTPSTKEEPKFFLVITDLATEGPERKIKLTSAEVAGLDENAWKFSTMSRNANGRWLAMKPEEESGPDGTSCKVWDLEAPGKPLEEAVIVCPVNGQAQDLTLSPDGRWLLVRGAARAWLFDLHDPVPASSRLVLYDDVMPLSNPPFFSDDSRWLLPTSEENVGHMGILLPLDDAVMYKRAVTILTDDEKKQYLGGDAAQWTPSFPTPALDAAGKVLAAGVLFQAMANADATPEFVKELAKAAQDSLAAAKKENTTLRWEPEAVFRALLEPALDSAARGMAEQGSVENALQVLEIKKEYGVADADEEQAATLPETGVVGADAERQAATLRETALQYLVLEASRIRSTQEQRTLAFTRLKKEEAGLAELIQALHQNAGDLSEMMNLQDGPWSPQAEARIEELHGRLNPLAGTGGIPVRSDWSEVLAGWSVWRLGGKVDPDNNVNPVARARELMESALQSFDEIPKDETASASVKLGNLNFEIVTSVKGRLSDVSRKLYGRALFAQSLRRYCWLAMLRGLKDIEPWAARCSQLHPVDDNLMVAAVALADSGKWAEAAANLKKFPKTRIPEPVDQTWPKLQDWIRDLENKKNPFTPDLMKELAKKSGVVWPQPDQPKPDAEKPPP